MNKNDKTTNEDELKKLKAFFAASELKKAEFKQSQLASTIRGNDARWAGRR
jgi:hypothetical protein